MQVTDVEVPVAEIDRDIYVMPAFVTLPTSDLDAARAWYAALGFVELAVMPPGTDSPQLVHLRRYRYQDVLLVPAADGAATGGGIRASFAHTAPLDELDTVAERLAALGTGTVAGPRTTPWYAVELEATDPDGHVVVLTGMAEQPPQAFVDEVRASVVDP